MIIWISDVHFGQNFIQQEIDWKENLFYFLAFGLQLCFSVMNPVILSFLSLL